MNKKEKRLGEKEGGIDGGNEELKEQRRRRRRGGEKGQMEKRRGRGSKASGDRGECPLVSQLVETEESVLLCLS
ncbi:hypothetical protein NHX12_006209 [Muraenolepis orangiensis]|uniref:Uncharacterized protein n=1 Tax=Muraenolepis orangiensis TaxID=630683 RepID=A0A9Q0ICV8_9TELE|nr:hypothetical protein NHX12_006209 [Muraenolepis orangiensis]